VTSSRPIALLDLFVLNRSTEREQFTDFFEAVEVMNVLGERGDLSYRHSRVRPGKAFGHVVLPLSNAESVRVKAEQASRQGFCV